MSTNDQLEKLIDDLGGQKKVADGIGVTQSAVSYWFTRQQGLPTIKRLLQLSDMATKHGISINIEQIARQSAGWKEGNNGDD